MRIGIDLGGTKIEGIALDSAGQERARHRMATPTGGYEATLDAVCNLIALLESGTGQQGTVGIGIPGTLSPATGLIKNANSTCLIGHALDRDLLSRLHRPVRIANDANCFAVSEATDGAGQGANMVFGVILGTGVGGGLAIKGIAHTGMNAIGGEWGHNPLPWPTDEERPGPECYCGKHGCIETFLSGPGLQLDFRLMTGEAISVEQIAERADKGDDDALRILARYEGRLARSLATIINVLDPDVIVLGGGLSNLDRIYTAVSDLWQNWVFSDRADTPIRKNKHGDSSGVRGAAWLWPPDTD
ncbi:MAG: ROK family protein [Rhodospirillales bacterium]|nr:ROK family protein [Rhodospirillales bacterium]